MEMKTYPEGQGFLGLPKPYCDLETARVAVVPFNLLLSGDTSKGPREIIGQSHKVQVFGDSFKVDIRKLGIATLDTKPEYLPPYNSFSISQGERKVIARVMRSGKLPIVVASENASAVFGFDAAQEVFGNVVFLRFDSRLNFKTLKDGETYGDGNAFWCLIERAEKSMFVGVRNAYPEEIEILGGYRDQSGDYNSERIHVFRERKNIREMGFETFWRSVCVWLRGKKVYFSFHLSVMDRASIDRDTTYFEPGGLSYNECLDFFREVMPHLDIVGADFTGIATDVSPGSRTGYTTAKLITRFITHLKLPSK